MSALVLTLVLAIVVFLLVKSVLDAQRAKTREQRPVAATRSAPPRPRARHRPRKAARPVDERALADHVLKLREAVDEGLISVDEAVASVVRHTEGQLSDEAARRLLREDGAA
jgi:hypothetical protein